VFASNKKLMLPKFLVRRIVTNAMPRKFPPNHPRPMTLRAIREAVYGSGKGAALKMAILLDIKANRYYNFENGHSVMPEKIENRLLDTVPWLGRSARPYIKDQDTSCLSLAALEALGLAKRRDGAI
jgi:hypothetical protein